MLKEKSEITVSVVEDKNFQGGYYMYFTEFNNTAVLRVNKDGKYNMRAVVADGEKFSYPWDYKFLLPTDETISKLESTFNKTTFNSDKELNKVVFPVYCYLSVLHQFYKKPLFVKKMWYNKFKDIEKRKFEKVRSIAANLPSRQALKLLPKEEQSTFIE